MSRSVSAAAFLIGAFFLFGVPPALAADDSEQLKRENELLKKENEAVKARIAELEKYAKKANEPRAVGSRWKGKSKVNDRDTFNVVVTVTERSDNAVTLSVTGETGAVWVFECTTEGSKLKITKATVAKGVDAAKGKKAVAGGTTGGGSVQSGKLTLNYVVAPYDKNP